LHIHSCYGHGDHEFATAASCDGAAAPRGRSEADHGEQGCRRYHEVHHRARARGLLAAGLFIAKV